VTDNRAILNTPHAGIALPASEVLAIEQFLGLRGRNGADNQKQSNKSATENAMHGSFLEVQMQDEPPINELLAQPITR
jgi:hypothetical protein